MKRFFLALLLVYPLAANATIVQITGQGAADGSWEISELASTYGDAESTLMNQIWWGDAGLSSVFANALGPIAITNPSYNASQNFGSFFAHRVEIAPPNIDLFFRSWRTSTNQLFNYQGIDFANPARSTIFVYATAIRVPEPGFFSLIGLGFFAIGLSSRRRRKI